MSHFSLGSAHDYCVFSLHCDRAAFFLYPIAGPAKKWNNKYGKFAVRLLPRTFTSVVFLDKKEKSQNPEVFKFYFYRIAFQNSVGAYELIKKETQMVRRRIIPTVRLQMENGKFNFFLIFVSSAESWKNKNTADSQTHQKHFHAPITHYEQECHQHRRCQTIQKS